MENTKPTSVEEIKGNEPATVEAPPVSTTVPQDLGTVEIDPSVKADITQGQLNTLMERINKLETGDRRPKLIKPTFNTVLVRFIDEKLVTGYGKSWEERGIDGSWRLITEVKYKDGDDIKVKKLDWLKFRQEGKSLEVKVIKVDANENVSSMGNTTIKNIDFSKYKTTDTGVEIPMEVVTPEPIYTVELPDGNKADLSHEAIN